MSRSSMLIWVSSIALAVPTLLALPSADARAEGTATVTGLVTSAQTGQPISGAVVTAFQGNVEYESDGTDQAGRLMLELTPGSYRLFVTATGFYPQDVGVPPASTSAAYVTVTSSGPNVFSTGLISSDTPYVGITEDTLTWRHTVGASFGSMIVSLRYGAYAVVPATWPEDALVIEALQGTKEAVEPEIIPFQAGAGGNAGSGFVEGSAVGCELFNGAPDRADTTALKLVAHLRDHPAVSVTQPIGAMAPECAHTELSIRSPRHPTRAHAPLTVRILNRAPALDGVPGDLTISINRHRRLTIPVRAPLDTVVRDVGRWLHPGQNSISVTFRPTNPSYSPPRTRRVVMTVANGIQQRESTG